MSGRQYIVVLEDEHRRRVEMFRLLDDRLYMYPVVWFRTAQEMNDWFESTQPSVVLAALDHDLEDTDKPAGTGRDVVDFLVEEITTGKFPIVLHSTNTPARTGMAEALREHDWQCCETPPYGDLEWIAESWFPAVKRMIRQFGTGKSAEAPRAGLATIPRPS